MQHDGPCAEQNALRMEINVFLFHLEVHQTSVPVPPLKWHVQMVEVYRSTCLSLLSHFDGNRVIDRKRGMLLRS